MTQQQVKDALCNAFPGLRKGYFKLTSPATGQYNCIAFAAGDDARWWEPGNKYPWHYWPPGAPGDMQLATLAGIFESLGYEACDRDELEAGYEKIALMGLGTQVLHATKQLPTGQWASKMGAHVDIRHVPSALVGVTYGNVLKVMRRKVQTQ